MDHSPGPPDILGHSPDAVLRPPSAIRPPHWRRWIAGAVGVLVVGLIVRIAAIQGWIVPVRVAGDSMAETLVGEHLRVPCADCRYVFRCGVEGTPDDGQVVCPNCGFAGNSTTGRAVHSGQRVWIDRFAYVGRSPRRGDLVALRDPLDDQRLVVKRVVGLPGEHVSILDGDLLIDEQRWQKSLAELRDVAVELHDERFRPERTATIPARWRHDDGWDVYHHWRCFPSPLPRTDDAPVLDNDPYNQNVSRPLRDVGDLLLVAKLFLATDEQAIVRITTVDGMRAIVCDAKSRTVELRSGPRDAVAPADYRVWPLCRSVPLSDHAVGRWTTVEIAVCDRRALVAIDGEVCLTHDDDRSGLTFQAATATPWATAIVGNQSRFDQRRVLRDLHYLDPYDLQHRWTSARGLLDGEYFLLGDNPSVSIDSRHWPNGGATSRSRIVGRVLRGSDH